MPVRIDIVRDEVKLQEQEAKAQPLLLDDAGNRSAVLARENGLARYERIVNFDWQAGDDYWARTGPFWSLVREDWQSRFARNKALTVEKHADQKSLVMMMFGLADKHSEGEIDAAAARADISSTLDRFTR